MNYVDFLTQEEKITLCIIITGREFKELFKRNEQDFIKIRKGFRAKTLAESKALLIAINNIEKPLIITYINEKVDMWLKEIQKSVGQLEMKGVTHDDALATTLLDSSFANHINLYFKLTEKTLDIDTYAKVCEKIESIKSECVQNAKAADHIKIIENEKVNLLNQIEELRRSTDTIRVAYEEQLQAIKQENDTLSSLLSEAQDRITELQNDSSADEGQDIKYLAQFDDTDTSVLPSVASEEIVSLCGVSLDHSGKKWLIRYADLSHSGHYHIFHKNEYIPPYFTNRDRIFYKDGPGDDEFYGIWTWTAIPNEKDPSKDYILSKYNIRPDIVEVVIVSQVSNFNGLIDLLRNGIKYRPHSRRVMFAFYMPDGRYMGVLCNIKDLNVINEEATLIDECIEVPVYEFTSDDILYLDNGLSFYGHAFVGLPSKLYSLKSTIDTVKSIVLSSISWSTYRTRGVIRAEYRAFKDFLSAIPTNDITCKIESTCHCSNSTAKEMLNEFLNVAWKYIDGDSLDDEIILSAISASTELQERTKVLIRADWEAANKALLNNARKELDLLDSKLKDAKVNLNEAKEAFNRTKLEEERLSTIIAEKEKLAENVEKAVAERIQLARENAADFIANMAFVGGPPFQTTGTGDTAIVESSCNTADTLYNIFPAYEEVNDLEEHHSWSEVIDTVAFELGEAGVTGKYRSGLATFLCAAYIQKQPLLLVGPNAIDVAQAFSAAVTAHKYGMLCCEGCYTQKIIEEIGDKGEDVVLINNLLASGWINRLPELISKKDIFYIGTHPYTEDIQVEPKSLYGFMLPLFTEFFVDKKASGKYCGGYFADDFEHYSPSNGTQKELRFLSKLNLTSLVRSQIKNLITTMHDIDSGITLDEEFLFAVLPIVYASLKIDELKEIINDQQKNIAISESLKRDLRYILGEV